MDRSRSSADQANSRIQVLAPSDGAGEPTVGAIKRALHELSRTASGSGQREQGAVLREAHDLLRRLAFRSGIDPDDAVQRSRAAADSQRERIVLASASKSGQASGQTPG
jgi:hypothetical protein